MAEVHVINLGSKVSQVNRNALEFDLHPDLNLSGMALAALVSIILILPPG